MNNIKIILSHLPVKHITNKKNIIISIKICISGHHVKHNTNNKISSNFPPVKDNINP